MRSVVWSISVSVGHSADRVGDRANATKRRTRPARTWFRSPAIGFTAAGQSQLRPLVFCPESERVA